MFGLEAGTVEYGEWKNGARTEGATHPIYSFTRKGTQWLGGALGSWTLAIGGYVAGAEKHPEIAVTAMKAGVGLAPAVVALLAMATFWRHPLTDACFGRIRSETGARQQAVKAASP